MKSYKEYVSRMGGSDEVQGWVDTTLAAYGKKNALEVVEVEHILDYLCSDQGPRKLRRMSYAQAKAKADAWTKAQQKKGRRIKEQEGVDLKTVHDFGDGTRIVKLLTKKAFQREGHLMRHCLGGYEPSDSVSMYSYRDAKNMPHVTLEVCSDYRDVQQVKGKGNGSINPRYVRPIVTFLQTIGVEIRDSEMQHLGYYVFNEQDRANVEKLGWPMPDVTTLFGVDYIMVDELLLRSGSGNGFGDGDGYGYGYGSGSGSGLADIYGYGYGYGSGNGFGDIYGYGSGSGYGDGSGDGSGYDYHNVNEWIKQNNTKEKKQWERNVNKN